jgi:hypothetical protein
MNRSILEDGITHLEVLDKVGFICGESGVGSAMLSWFLVGKDIGIYP